VTAVPTVSPLDIYGGNTFTRTYTLYSDLEQTQPIDLSAWTFTAEWRSARSVNYPPIAMTVDDSGASTGVITIGLDASDTEAMTVTGVWDLRGVKNGEVRTWLQGPVVWTAEVTRV
jgi:hypothetical protein